MEPPSKTRHPITKKLVADILKIKGESNPIEILQGDYPGRAFFDTDFGSLTLSEEEELLHSQMIATISKYRNIGKTRDLKTLEYYLNEIIVRSLSNPAYRKPEALFAQIDNALDTLLKALPERKVYFPIPGIKLEEVSIQIGNCTIMPLTEEFLQKLRLKTVDILVSSPGGVKPENIEKTHEIINANFKNVSVGQLTVTTDPGIAVDGGLVQINEGLDYLAALMPTIAGLHQRVWFEIGPPPGKDSYQVFTEGPDNYTISWHHNRPILPIVIGKTRLARLERLGLNTLLKIAYETITNSCASRIRLMAKLLGRSFRVSEKQERFILAMTALEAAFSTKETDPVVHQIREGVAFLIGKAIEERQKLLSIVGDLYSKRSKLVHGQSWQTELSDLHRLQDLALTVLIISLVNFDKLSLAGGMNRWIERQKLSTDPYDLVWPEAS